jgi:tRNA nucleotidyltransferase (CCA-adding enzyme)
MNADLRDKILHNIKFSVEEEENLKRAVSRFIRKLNRAKKKLNYDCDFFIGGSFGKGTYLKGNFDVDIFCMYNQNYEDEKLSENLSNILDEANLKYKKQKGSRDYYSLFYGRGKNKILYEIIPNRKIVSISEGINSTDYSPSHVNFLKEKIKENPIIADEIRLTKQFLKAKSLYGAESYIGGFSGHVIDILITYYGSLDNFIKNAKLWEEETFIDINSFYDSEDEAYEVLGEDKKSNLILIDPILKNRNAARALSNEKYSEFILKCQRIDVLEERDFIIEYQRFSDILDNIRGFTKKNNLKAVIYDFKFKIESESEDIVGSKLLKIHKKTQKFFEDYEFRVFLNDFHINIKEGRCLMIFLFEKIKLANVKKIYGPKVFMKPAVEAFLKGRDSYFIEDSRVCVYEKRVISTVEEIYKLTINDFRNFLQKDLSFLTSLRVRKY